MSSAVSTRPGPTRAQWIAFGSITAGTFVVTLDRTMVTVALPQIGADLGAVGLDAVVTANLIAVAVASPGSGWLAQRFGARRVLVTALGTFAVASVAAASSASLGMLIATRAVQGASGGITMAVTLAAIHALFDQEHRARAFATQAAVVMVSPALGPIFGGYLSEFEWRITFIASAIIATGALLLAARFLKQPMSEKIDGAFDWQGWVLAGVGFPLILLITTSANEWGWISAMTIGVAILAAIVLTIFARRELRLPHPLVELRILGNRMLRTTFMLEWLVTIPYQAQFVLLPLELTTVADVSPLHAGMMITPSAIGTIIALRPASYLLTRYGVRLDVIIGSVLLIGATFALSFVTPATSLATIAVIMVAHGMGGGLCLMPLLVAGLDSVDPRDVPQVSAMRIVNKLLAQAVGVSVAVGLLIAFVGNSDLLAAARDDAADVVAAYATVDRLLVIPAVIALVVAITMLPARAPKSIPHPTPVD